MGHGTTLFLLGILAFQQLESLPALAWVWLIPVVLVLGVRWRRLRMPVWFVCGFLWTLLHAHHVLGDALAPALEGEDLVVEGVIAAIPERLERGRRFEVRVDRLVHGGKEYPAPGRVRLSWYDDAPELHAGERWRLKVRLRRPHGFANPGGFDYEAWSYRKRIRAVGYVRDDALNRRIDTAAAEFRLQGVREWFSLRIAESLDYGEMHGVVIALAVGDYQAISGEQWEIFRRTGTTHLVAISGMHIALVAGMIFFAMRWTWPRIGNLALHYPAPHAAGVAATFAALIYAALAGFSVPTQRALIMVAVVMIALLLRRHRSLFHTLMAALLFVLLFDPLAVMDAGAWLSFCAVAIILFCMDRRIGAGGWWWRWGRLHVLITIGLAPPLVVMFHQLPLASPLANFIAVPWVGIGVVPPTLAGALLLPVSPPVAGLLLSFAETLLVWLWPVLALISGAESLQWTQHAPGSWMLAAAVVATILLLAPRGMPGRWLAVPWLLPAVLLAPPAPAEGEFRMTLLDVGQGLAAVVRTRDHVLVYDTGARFSPAFDAGSAVVLPYLRSQGITAIDILVISHDDNDHIGGAASLAGAIEVRRVISGTPDAISWWPAEHCVDGDAWTWNGVLFEILHPAPDAGLRGNDVSCVLRAGNGAGAVLLTGDIEARAERMLVRAHGERLKSDILVAPHHGSRTSSGWTFIDTVDPSDVLFPAGYRNRWNHPHPEIVARYRVKGRRMYHSAEHGAIIYTIPAEGGFDAPVTWRQQRQRYWHAD